MRELGCGHVQGYMYGKPSRCEDVVASLEANGRSAQIVGRKMSRAPREKVLLKAQPSRRGAQAEAVVRNVSVGGALIESDLLSPADVGSAVSVESLQGQIRWGAVKWVDGNRAGVSLAGTTDEAPAALPAGAPQGAAGPADAPARAGGRMPPPPPQTPGLVAAVRLSSERTARHGSPPRPRATPAEPAASPVGRTSGRLDTRRRASGHR